MGSGSGIRRSHRDEIGVLHEEAAGSIRPAQTLNASPRGGAQVQRSLVDSNVSKVPRKSIWIFPPKTASREWHIKSSLQALTIILICSELLWMPGFQAKAQASVQQSLDWSVQVIVIPVDGATLWRVEGFV